VVEFGLWSLKLLFKFIDYLQDERKLGHGGRFIYIDATSEIIDLSSPPQICTSKEARKTVAKMIRLQWTQHLDIETLEAIGRWVTMEELLEVVEFHLPRYEMP